jgi:hypothetical protein
LAVLLDVLLGPDPAQNLDRRDLRQPRLAGRPVDRLQQRAPVDPDGGRELSTANEVSTVWAK